MHYRIAQIFAPKDVGTDGTEVIDLSVVDPISRILVRFRARNGSDDMDDCAAANVLKVELVDGSDVLFSCSGKEAQAVNFYNRGKLPWMMIDGIDDHWNEAVIGIDFGRYLYDPILALDPMRFRNLQLKVTYDEDVCELEADENFLSVYAFLFDEKKITPSGFLSSREVKSYSPTAGAYEYIDLPVDHVIRGIFVNSRLAEYTPTVNIGEVRLSEDSDKRIPVDLTSAALARMIYEKYGSDKEFCYMEGTTTVEYIFGVMCNAQFAAACSYGDDQDVSIWTQDGGKWAYWMAANTLRVKGVLHGYMPHGSMPVLFHNDQDPEDWYNVTRIGSLQLRVKAGASMGSGATAQVVIQQLRKY